MTKQGIICPNCGAEIMATGTLVSECPYCGGIVANEQMGNNKRTEGLTPKRLIPFLLKKEEMIQTFLNYLVVKDYVPTDIFDNLSIKDIHKVYVPMYRYNGTIDVSWSCTVVYRRKRTIGDKTEYYEEYHPASGKANSGFNLLCLAIDKDILPKEIQKLTEPMKYVSEYSKNSVLYDNWTLNETENVDVQFIWTDKDEASIWNGNNSINWYIDGIAREAAYAQAPLNKKDFSFTWNCSASHGELILVPFWFVYYSYKGNNFCFVIDGVGYKRILSNPIDNDEKDNVKRIEDDEKQRLKAISNKSSAVIWSTLAFLLISLVSYDFNPGGSILLALTCIFASILSGIRFGKEKKAVKSVAKCRKEASKSIAKYQRMIGKARYCDEPIPDKPQGTDAQFEYEDTKSDKLYICILFLVLVFFSAIALSPLFFQNVKNRNNFIKDGVYKQAEKPIVVVDSACCDSTVAEEIYDTLSLPVEIEDTSIKLSFIYEYPTENNKFKTEYEVGTDDEGLQTLKIYKDGDYLQSVKVSIFPSCNEAYFVDMNFDGYVDLFLGIGGSRTENAVLIWDSTNGRFETNEMLHNLQNPYFDATNKAIYDCGSSSVYEYWYSKYEVEKGNITKGSRLLVISDLEKYNEANADFPQFQKSNVYTLYDKSDTIIQGVDNEEDLPQEWKTVVSKVKDYNLLLE